MDELSTRLEELWEVAADRSDGSLVDVLDKPQRMLVIAPKMMTRADNVLATLEKEHNTASLEVLDRKIALIDVRPSGCVVANTSVRSP